MSASAVATPVQLQPSAAASSQDMEDEDQVDIHEEEIDEAEELTSKSNDDLEDKEMVTLSEAESQAVDAQLRAMAVSSTTAPRDQAPSTATSTGTRSAGESLDDANSQDRPKPFVRSRSKFESGSGSGDQDGMVSMEDGVDVAVKKRKTRRGKPKHRKLKPYSKQQPSYQQRLRSRASGRPDRKASRQPTAPYNTTQFLMEDHNDLPDLDEKIAATGSSAVAAMANEVHSHFSKNDGASRTRDSSFSIDSDNDYFYSSPEDEEEFLQKEFTTAYEDEHHERLGAMTRAQLIQEYIQLEAKVELLNKRLRKSQAGAPSSGLNDSDVSSKLRSCQLTIEQLQKENEQLRRENEMLRKQRHGSPMSSVDSESDSSDSDSSRSRGSQNASPNSSPVPASYQAKREKTHARERNNSVSSVDSESDSSTTNGSAPDNDEVAEDNPAETTSTGELANGHATAQEIDGLPT